MSDDDFTEAKRPVAADEWPPRRARSQEDWAAYWERQRWDRRLRRRLRIRTFRWRRRLRAPLRWPRQVRWFLHRARRGWAAPDVWSMDGYICRVLGEMTVALKGSQSHPCLGHTEDGTGCGNLPEGRACTCEQDWEAILDGIAAPLLAYHTHWDWADGMTVDEHIAHERRVFTAAQDALGALAGHLPSLWD